MPLSWFWFCSVVSPRNVISTRINLQSWEYVMQKYTLQKTVLKNTLSKNTLLYNTLKKKHFQKYFLFKKSHLSSTNPL